VGDVTGPPPLDGGHGRLGHNAPAVEFRRLKGAGGGDDEEDQADQDRRNTSHPEDVLRIHPNLSIPYPSPQGAVVVLGSDKPATMDA